MMREKAYIICESTNVPEKPQIMQSTGTTTKIKTTLQTADMQNRNTRIYGKDIINDGLAAPFVQERLKSKSWYGEAGHPRTQDPKRMMDYDHHNLAHIVESIYWDTNNPHYLKGIVETANTAIGRDMKGLIDQGSKVAFSLRALGNVVAEKGDILRVQSPLRMFCYDWVVHPSHKEAYMDEIMTESVRNMFEFQDNTLTEGVMIPVHLTESEIIDLVEQSSQNFRDITNQLEMNMLSESAHIELDSKRNSVLITEGEKKVIVNIEEYAKRSLDDYLLTKI